MDRKENYDGDFAEVGFYYPADFGYEEMIAEVMPKKEAVQEAAAYAVSEIYGVLGLRGAFHEVIPVDDDAARGITVQMGKDGAKIEARLIADIGWDVQDLTAEVAENVAETVEAETGVTVREAAIEVVKSMPREEFEDKYCGGRMQH